MDVVAVVARGKVADLRRGVSLVAAEARAVGLVGCLVGVALLVGCLGRLLLSGIVVGLARVGAVCIWLRPMVLGSCCCFWSSWRLLCR